MGRIAAKLRHLFTRSFIAPRIEQRIRTGQQGELLKIQKVIRWLNPRMQWTILAELHMRSSQIGDPQLRRLVLELADALSLSRTTTRALTSSTEVVVTVVGIVGSSRRSKPKLENQSDPTTQVKVINRYYALPTLLRKVRGQILVYRRTQSRSPLKAWTHGVSDFVTIWRHTVCFQIRYNYDEFRPSVSLGFDSTQTSLDPALSYWERELLPDIRDFSGVTNEPSALLIAAVIPDMIPGQERKPRDWLEAGIRSHPGVVMELVGESPRTVWVEKLKNECNPGPYRDFFKALAAAISQGESHSKRAYKVRIPIRELDAFAQSEVTSHAQFPELEYVCLSDVTVMHARFLIRRDELLLLDSASDPRASFVAGLWQYALSAPTLNGQAFVARNLRTRESINEGICAFGRADENWFHWIMETLPRALYLDSVVDKSVPFLMREGLPSPMRQSLEALSSRPIKLVTPNAATRVRRLHGTLMRSPVLDSVWPDNLQYYPNRLAIQLVKDAVNSKITGSETKAKDKVSHLRNSTTRRILNKEHVAALLKSQGFRETPFFNDSFEQQVRSQRQAAIFVCQGGAGLVNALFLPPQTPVVILSSTNQRQDIFWTRVLQHYGVKPLVARTRSMHGSDSRENPHADFSVDTSSLERLTSDVV